MLAVEDKRLFCELCQLYFSDSCPAHGPPHFVRDSPVPEDGAGQRAVNSLPQCLVLVERSQDPAGELGVFSQARLSQGWIFGPYEGEGLLSRKACTKYSWAIKDKGFFFYVDASDESKSNWMRYVACASNEEEQNLAVFQYHGRIYYRVSKPIPAGAELRVWIGREYATMLGLQLGDHIKFEFGEKEVLMKMFQDIQVVSVSGQQGGAEAPPPSIAIGDVHSEARGRRSPPVTQTVSSTNPPVNPDSSLNPARPALKFNFVKGSESLVSLSRAQSRYWTFFGFEANRFGQFLDKTKIICKLCGGRLAYSGNTTNLRQHLIYKHRREFNQLMESGVAGPLHASSSPTAAFAGPPRGGQRPPPAPPGGAASPRLHRGGEGNASVSSSVNRLPPTPPAAPLPPAPPPPDVSALRATDAIADFLVRDLLPPQTVEGEGFRLLMSTLLPSYQPPSADFLSRTVLGEAYARGRAKWAELLGQAVGAGSSEKPPVAALPPDGPPTQDRARSDSEPSPAPADVGSSPLLLFLPPSSSSTGPREGGARSRVAISGEVWRHGWRGDGVSYITLSAHFVDEDFRQHSLTLSSRRLGEEGGGGAGAAEALVRAMAREWGVATPSFILLGGEEGVWEREKGGDWEESPGPNPDVAVGDDPGVAGEESPAPGSAPFWPPVSCVFTVLRECVQRVLQLPAASRALTRCEALVSKLLPPPAPPSSRPAPAPSPRLAELLADPALLAPLESWRRGGVRWDSLYAGIQTLSDSRHALSRVLEEVADPTGLPEPCDWSLLRELCCALKPLDVACSTLARERFPRLSLVKPVLTSLLSRHFAVRPGDSAFASETKRVVRESLEGRYAHPEVNRALNLACALDPRFRGLEFVEAEERAETLGRLNEEAVRLAREEGPGEGGGACEQRAKRAGSGVSPSGAGTKRARRAGETEPEGGDYPRPDTRGRRGAGQELGATVVLDDDAIEAESEARPSGPAPKEKGLSDMEFLLGGLCPARPQTPHRSLAQQVEREAAIFRAEPGAELGEEPLQWWRERASQLPLLARAARVYLAAPATAGHAPRLLAQGVAEGGGAMFRKRANIPPELLDQLLFLHHNRLSITAPGNPPGNPPGNAATGEK